MEHYREELVNVVKNHRKYFENNFVYQINISVPISAAGGDYSRLLKIGRMLINSNKKTNSKTNREFFKECFHTGVYKITISDDENDGLFINYIFLCFSLSEVSTEVIKKEILARVKKIFDAAILIITSNILNLKEINTVFDPLEKHSSINIYSDSIKSNGIEFLLFVLDILLSSIQSFGLLYKWGFCYYK